MDEEDFSIGGAGSVYGDLSFSKAFDVIAYEFILEVLHAAAVVALKGASIHADLRVHHVKDVKQGLSEGFLLFSFLVKQAEVIHHLL